MVQSKVSVVMCTYNGAKYLKEQLDSILNQTYPLHEIIVQDDGSTDDTLRILHQYAEQYSIIKVYRNTGRHGVNANFLTAMQRAEGDFIAISDQDDIWQPDKTALQVEAMGSNLLCSGHSRPFSTDGSFAHFDPRPRNTSIFRMLFLGLPGHTMLLRRELLAMLPPLNHPFYDVSLYDAALAIVAAAHGRIVFLNKVLVNFRRHSTATTYTDYSKSLPSWQNAAHELGWSVCHYRAIRKEVLPLFRGKLALLESISKPQSPDFPAAKRMMELECGTGFTPLLQLQWLLIKHHSKLFHTPGGGITKAVRAFLYPFMQLYAYRDALLRKK